ncbi:hypothetical protein OIU85_006482 [Salix viminalis]|uniref:Uncharacterized protein n=1 Tax=Salix viminalis TaxID=40686 RepID=A0A9Q0PKZ3_SALVM|nr:hypothetical protein OIU85_006482 [Salix viminalis]KAJ6690205.1 hypothetical protein OIU85_006482 [Salix viminalis]
MKNKRKRARLERQKMGDSLSALHALLIQLSETILNPLSQIPYTPPEGTPLSPKSTLVSLLSFKNSNPNPKNNAVTETQLFNSIKDFTLACALLSSSQSSTHELLSWIPKNLAIEANSAFKELSNAYVGSDLGGRNERRISELLGVVCGGDGLVNEEKRLVIELLPEVFPLLKDAIKESSIDKSADGDEISAASARAPVGSAIVAAYQFRWFVTQVDYPHLGKLCNFVIPCALTALDHWSPQVKGQGMISFTHLAKNVNAAELGQYEDVILDACCQNIVSDDEIWYHVVEMSVLLVTCLKRSNPRSPWFEKMLNEMLGHLERQPRNKDRRVAWLTFVEPLLHGIGLVLVAHFRRIFPLFFKWLHADDDETVLLVLERVHTIMRLTWIRNTPFLERLVDELALLYKEAALRTAREQIRSSVLEILILLQQCKGLQFKAAWDKHSNDVNLTGLCLSLSGNTTNTVDAHADQFHGDSLQRSSQPLKPQ